MKYLFLLASCSVIHQYGCIPEGFEELAKRLHKTCVDKTGVSEDLISHVDKNRELPDDEKLKCYLKCLFEELPAMTEDGKIDVEKLVTFIPEQHQDLYAPIVRKCGSVGLFLGLKCEMPNIM